MKQMKFGTALANRRDMKSICTIFSGADGMIRLAITKTARSALVTAAVLVAALAATATHPAMAASEIAAVVNDRAITTGDIRRRIAFLKLQRSGGNLNEKAREQLINETLQLQEAARLGAVASDAQVDQAVQRFADSNNLSSSQMQQVLNQAGVGIDHFRDYVRAQLTWPRIVQARFRQQGDMSNQELVAKMLERGAGNQPSTTEYVLQQVIFVVPEDRRSAILAQRQREAQQLRSRFTNCESTRQFAAALTDVAVRDLGRVMLPELPSDWKDQIVSTEAGGTTSVRTTDRGVEFIAVCSARQVSDDRAAELIFRSEEQDSETMAANAQKYLEELKDRASISYR